MNLNTSQETFETRFQRPKLNNSPQIRSSFDDSLAGLH